MPRLYSSERNLLAAVREGKTITEAELMVVLDRLVRCRDENKLLAKGADGQRLYVLLALFDRRDGSTMADLIHAAREGWERSHPDMAEEGAWAPFDAMWNALTPEQRHAAVEGYCQQANR